MKCKHIFAVEFTIRRETNSRGETTVTKSVKVTYRQNWTAYNAAQTTEKAQFMVLLSDLCKSVAEPGQTLGRPRLPLSDMVFSAAFKVYSTISARRFMSDLVDAYNKGYLSRLPRHSALFKYLEMPALTSAINSLIIASSLPLKAVETDFAVDSSGFGLPGRIGWREMKYGSAFGVRQDWVKVHLMTGVKTNIVTSVELSDRYGGDSPFFPSLVEATAQNFSLREVSADKAYSSRKNLSLVSQHGATPYIPFKDKTVANPQDALWTKMYHYFMFNRDSFMTHYHKRSNVETTFSMIKAKFGEQVRAKTSVAQANEVLCKVLCHNICVVIQSIYELGIEPTLWTESAVAHKVT